MEGSNHLYHRGIAVNLDSRNQSWDWIINIHDGEPGLNDDYVLALVGYENVDQNVDHCTLPLSDRITYYPILFETIKLIAFPDSKNEMWYKYNDTGLYRFAKSGLIDTRLNSIIEVKDMLMILHNYNTGAVKTFDLSLQVGQYRIDRPLAVRPSIVIFSISFIIIIILVMSEVATQRRVRMAILKSRKNDEEFELKDSLLVETTNARGLQFVQNEEYEDEDEGSITEIK